MKKEKSKLKIIFRNPVYPVIIVSKDKLLSGSGIRTLALSLLNSTPQETKRHIAVIDSTGEEFWYSPEFEVLSPGFAFKRWTKKQIIDLFNESSNSKEMQMTYSEKSLSSKKLSKIIFDVCKLLNSHNHSLHLTAGSCAVIGIL